MTDLLKKLKKTSEVTTVSPTTPITGAEAVRQVHERVRAMTDEQLTETVAAARERDLEPMGEKGPNQPPAPTALQQPIVDGQEMVTIGKATVAKADCIYVEMADSGSIAGYKFKRGERLWVPKDALSGLAGKYVLVKKP